MADSTLLEENKIGSAVMPSADSGIILDEDAKTLTGDDAFGLLKQPLQTETSGSSSSSSVSSTSTTPTIGSAGNTPGSTWQKDRFGNLVEVMNSDLVRFNQTNPTINPDNTYEQRLKEQSASIGTEYDDAMTQLKGLMAGREARTNALITNITATYEQRKKDMEKINQARLGNMQTIGARTGTQRYMPSEFGAGITQEEREGLGRIASLDREAQGLIMQAQDALENSNFRDFTTMMQLASDKRAEERQALLDQSNLADAAMNRALNKAKGERELKAYAAEDIQNFISSGMSLKDMSIQQKLDYEKQLGLNPGTFDKYYATQEKALTATSIEDQIKLANSIYDLLDKVPTNQELKIGDNIYTGLKNDANTQIFSEEDASGNMTYVTIDKTTGEIVSKVSGGRIGKGFKGSSSSSDGGGTWSNNSSNPSVTGKTYNFDDPNVVASLPISQVSKSIITGYGSIKDLTPTDKARVLSELYQVGYDPKKTVMNKLDGLYKLLEQIPPENRGILQGLVPGNLTGNAKVNAFESAKIVLTRQIARLYDVGMLSDQDVKDYKNAMPSRDDYNLASSKAKVEGLKSVVGATMTLGNEESSQNRIRVKQKSTGQVGTIPENEFDSNLYEKL